MNVVIDFGNSTLMQSPIELVDDYLRCLQILREFCGEDETLSGCMLINKAIESVIMYNSKCFRDFLDNLDKYRCKLVCRHNGNLPIAYYYELWLKQGEEVFNEN